MSIDELKDFAVGVKTKLERLYGSYMINKELPVILYKKPSELRSKDIKDEEDDSLFLLAKNNLGLSIRDKWVIDFIQKHASSYKGNTIFVFDKEGVSGNQLLSILTHELVHYFFIGIDNSTDVGQGYNEACTDYLAKLVFGENYFSSYHELAAKKPKQGYMKAYANFYYAKEEAKSLILDFYLAIPKNEY